MSIRTCEILYDLSQVISIDFNLFLIKIIKRCEVSNILPTYVLYVQILNGKCLPGLDKSCEISYDFSQIISINF